MGQPWARARTLRNLRRHLRVSLLVLLAMSPLACGPRVRYIVTATPMNIVGRNFPGLCLAVDPRDRNGVWWWQPGPSGCAGRITGPDVFRAEKATVMADASSGAIDVRFELQMHSGTRDMRLRIENGTIRDTMSNERVPTERRRDLDIPPAFGSDDRTDVRR